MWPVFYEKVCLEEFIVVLSCQEDQVWWTALPLRNHRCTTTSMIVSRDGCDGFELSEGGRKWPGFYLNAVLK